MVNANGLRHVRVTAVMSGAQNVSLGDVWAWQVKPQSRRGYLWEEGRPRSQSETCLPGLGGAVPETEHLAGRGCGAW